VWQDYCLRCLVAIRLLLTSFVFVSLGFAQKLPSYQWVQEVDASGSDSLAGLGTDAQGNIYIAGSTQSRNFPVKGAVQGTMASSGLYRINGTGFTALGLKSVSAVAATQGGTAIYAVSSNALLKSSDGGASFTAVSLPSSQVSAVAIAPGNDQVVFAGTGDQGVLKSSDGGVTWAAVGARSTIQNLWIDPANPAVIFAGTSSGLVRSGDGGASWQVTTITDIVQNINFGAGNAAGVVYVGSYHAGFLKSTDYGQTFSSFSAPKLSEVLPDQNHPGQLIGAGLYGLFLSTDDGATWTQKSTTPVWWDMTPDWQDGVFYVALATNRSILRISGDLQSVTPAGPPSTGYVNAITVANGQLYAANEGSSDVFVTKLDPLGNIIYSTYFGGSGDDSAMAMTVDANGNVFVAGSTNSRDFPVSKGAYASSGSVFVFKLNRDGSLGYSTYFSGTSPVGIATDGSGSAWLAGTTLGNLPVTPGALSATFCCDPGYISTGPPIVSNEASLTRFDSAGSSLVFSTYVAGSSVTSTLGIENPASALAVAADGTAYLGGVKGIFHIDATGSSLLSSMPAAVDPAAMVIAPDGSLYVAGSPVTPGVAFLTTAGAFQPALPGQKTFGAQIAAERVDAGLKNVMAATYFSNVYSDVVSRIALDGAGNLNIGGSTGQVGLPTRTPFAGGFASPTGFLATLSGDLSTLLFSSYFGDTENFTVSGVGMGANGSVVIGGVTGQSSSAPTGYLGNIWLNSLALTPPPALRIDTVANAASLLDGPLAAGETILITGAGFGSDARILIGGEAVVPVSITPTVIAATVPADVAAGAVAVQVQSGGVSSNSVLMPTTVIFPGIFSANGTGYGQGYILNKDGTLNTPGNPAAPGDRITVMATGVGPLSLTQGYAVTEYPVNVFIDGVYCAGVAATLGPVSGLPGDVYRITVYVPNPAVLFAGSNPGFKFPASTSVVMKINGAVTQTGITISIAQ